MGETTAEQASDPVAAKKSLSQSEQNKEDYKKEAEFALKLSGLSGIWETHKVTTVDGQIAIIQKKAGFKVTGQDKPAVELSDFSDLLMEDKLTQSEQLVFLNMVEDFLKGVQSMHKQGMLHRDIKGRNVLVSKEGAAGLSDFGLTCYDKIRTEKGDSIPDPNKESIGGSPFWMPPEMAHLANENTADWQTMDGKLDIWSTGMTLWEVLSGKDITQHPIHKMNRVSSAYRALFHLYHLARQEEGLKGNEVNIKVLHYNHLN